MSYFDYIYTFQFLLNDSINIEFISFLIFLAVFILGIVNYNNYAVKVVSLSVVKAFLASLVFELLTTVFYDFFINYSFLAWALILIFLYLLYDSLEVEMQSKGKRLI